MSEYGEKHHGSGKEDCQAEGPCDNPYSKHVPVTRRKELLKFALDIVEQIEKVKYTPSNSKSERECLLRMIETILNENR